MHRLAISRKQCGAFPNGPHGTYGRMMGMELKVILAALDHEASPRVAYRTSQLG
jgi:hypothetical protein